jgi:hypothetical protein
MWLARPGALDFKIAKKKRDDMLIDIGLNEDFAIAIVDSELFSVLRNKRSACMGIAKHSSQSNSCLHRKLRPLPENRKTRLEAG